MKRTYLPVLVCIILSACAKPKPEFLAGKIVDLSHPFDAQTIYWPTEEGFKLENERWHH